MMRSRGFILLTTVLMISLLSILVLTSLQAVYLEFKMINQLIANHRAFYQLEETAKKLAQQIDQLQHCVTQDSDLTHMDSVLLQHQGCKIQNQDDTFYYLFTDLGRDNCLVLRLDNIFYTSHQWLVSVMYTKLPGHVLEVRLAFPDEKSACESPKVLQLNGHQMSWRYAGRVDKA